jgi:hypothetical protein
MQLMNLPPQAISPAQDTRRWASPSDLQRVASGQVALGEALQLLSQCREEQMRADADLREREAWAVTSILARAETVWDLLARPTLRFTLDRLGDPVPYHLEVGRYAHLAVLPDLTPGEQTLIASPAPCWARVYPHHVRHQTARTGPLARSYVPITAAEAVATLGMGTILSAIETAIRAAGSDLHAELEHQNRRRQRLLDAERMLGWDEDPPDVPMDRATMTRARLALLLLGHGGRTGYVLGVAFVGFLVILLCLLF